MRELSLHILDVVENGLRAGASHLGVAIVEDHAADRLAITISDDGCGMDAETARRALDPFYTTRTSRRVGLGLPMLADAAGRTGGRMSLRSRPQAGTIVEASFGLSHIDRQPLGDVASTLIALIVGNPASDFIYRHETDGRVYLLDTRDLKKALEDVPLSHPEVTGFLREHIAEGLRDIGAAA